MKLGAGWAIALPIFACAMQARGDDGARVSASLSVQRASGAESCIEQSALERAVEQRLGRRVFVPEANADIEVRVRLFRNERTKWSATVVLLTPGGELIGKRELSETSDTCATLGDSVTLVLALVVDTSPDAVKLAAEAQPKPAQPEPAPEPDAPKLAPEPDAPKPTKPKPPTPVKLPALPARRGDDPWQARAGLLASLSFGALPGLGAGVGLELGVTPPGFWEIRATGSYWFEQRAERSDEQSGAFVSMQRLGLMLCPVRLREKFVAVWACGGADVGFVQVVGYGFEENRDGNELLYGVMAKFGGDLQISGPLAFRAGLGPYLALARNRLVYSAPDGSKPVVYEMGVLAVQADAGLSVGF